MIEAGPVFGFGLEGMSYVEWAYGFAFTLDIGLVSFLIGYLITHRDEWRFLYYRLACAMLVFLTGAMLSRLAAWLRIIHREIHNLGDVVGYLPMSETGLAGTLSGLILILLALSFTNKTTIYIFILVALAIAVPFEVRWLYLM